MQIEDSWSIHFSDRYHRISITSHLPLFLRMIVSTYLVYSTLFGYSLYSIMVLFIVPKEALHPPPHSRVEWNTINASVLYAVPGIIYACFCVVGRIWCFGYIRNLRNLDGSWSLQPTPINNPRLCYWPTLVVFEEVDIFQIVYIAFKTSDEGLICSKWWESLLSPSLTDHVLISEEPAPPSQRVSG